MLFARRVFLAGGVVGIAAAAPLVVLESWLGRAVPPVITHPELFYGMVLVTLTWHAALVVIAGDPVRYRPLMPVCIAEKAAVAFAFTVLGAAGRAPAIVAAAALVDALFAVLFAIAYRRTPRAAGVSAWSGR